MNALLALSLVFAADAAAPATTPAQQPQAEPGLSGVAAAPTGDLLVSPAPGDTPAVLEIGPDGALLKSWPYPDGAPLEIVDADPSGRPILLDARGGRILVLDPGKSEPAATIDMKKVKGAESRPLAPLVRAAPDGGVMIAAADGASVLHVSLASEAKAIPLSGPANAIADFDIADDGRIAVLDSQSGRLRLYAGDGTLTSDVAIDPSLAGKTLFAAVRFAPGAGADCWVLDLPSAPSETAPQAGLSRFDAHGKRLSRMDHYLDGRALDGVAGLAPTRDGMWIVSLAGDARRLDSKGAIQSRFDATAPPHGMAWDEKTRLLKVAANPDGASLDDLVAALSVSRDPAKTDDLWQKILGDPAAAVPKMVTAVDKQYLGGTALAMLIVKGWPATKDGLTAAFSSKTAAVRNACVATLRDPQITGFDKQLAAATSDADPDVRASAIVVVARNHWTDATVPLVVARLGDADPDVEALAGQVLAANLPQTVDAVAKVVRDPKATEKARTMAARTLLLDVPGGEQLQPLPPAKHAALKSLAQSEDPIVRKVGALALVVHGDASAPAVFERVWPSLAVDQKKLGLQAWSPAMGDAGAELLVRLLGKEKNTDLRPALLTALARMNHPTARAYLLKLATTQGGDERDRATAIELVQRKMSDAQIAKLAAELPNVGSDLRTTILRIAGARGVDAAAPAIASLAADTDDAARKDAFAALYAIGSTAGVAVAVKRVQAGTALPDVELAYLASTGVPSSEKPAMQSLASAGGVVGAYAAEALARSGDASGLQALLDHARADRYGGTARDPALAGAFAALKNLGGRDNAKKLLDDPNPATREDGAVALSLMGGDACRDVSSWAASPRADGVAIPAAFFAVAACGDASGAASLYERAVKSAREGDPVASTAEPESFSAILVEMLRQPDFRAKADPVLAAVPSLPRPTATAVAQQLTQELHPAIAIPAMKYLF